MDNKGFNPDLLISHRYPLSKLPEVFKRIDARDKDFVYNKIMFFPHEED